MYIYEITNYYYDEEEKDNVYGFAYVIHEKEFTSNEFVTMCEKAREKLVGGVYGDDICKYLIENYGFNNMPIKACYEYDIDEEL
jgi:hypothetical protein